MAKMTGITARTTMLAWTVTMITLGIFVVFIVPEQRRDLQVGLQSKAQGVAAVLQGDVASAAVSDDYSMVIDHAMGMLAGDRSVDFLVIVKKDGHALLMEREHWHVLPTIDSYWHPGPGQYSSGIEVVPRFNRRLYHYVVPFQHKDLPWGWVHIGLSLNSYDASVRLIYRRTGILAVLCILLSLAASLLYARHLVDPILRLRAVVEQVAGGDLMARADFQRKDEIAQLADAFNNMADAILHRNRIVESVRFTAQSLQSANDWSQTIDRILAKIGYAMAASRAQFWKRNLDAENIGQISLRFEWTAEKIAPWREQSQDIRLEGNKLAEVRQRLMQGEIVILREAQKGLSIKPPHLESAPLSVIIAPISVGYQLWGTLVVQDCERDREWSEVEQDSVRIISEMMGATIVRQDALQALFEAKNELEHRVVERTRELWDLILAKDRAHAELEAAQKRVIELSRLSGMAEVATCVLHNVGNVLNSINVSSTIVGDRLRTSRVNQLKDLTRILIENQDEIGTFLLQDPKGRRILPYLDRLSDHLVEECNEMSAEMAGLLEHVGHVKDIIAMQQSYARTSGVLEKVAFHTLIEDSMRITREEMDRQGIHLRAEIEEVPLMMTDRNKILQILLNLLRNAKDAVSASRALTHEITVRLRAVENGFLRLEIADNGIGIATENLARIFSHGFTTKKDGHGFGLHFGALAARQLGGSLRAESEGLNRGTTFTLELPIDARNHE